MGFDFLVFALEFFFEYLVLKGLPLFLSEDAGIAFLSYFHSCICYLDYRATGAFAA
jgi:hypothetical protein